MRDVRLGDDIDDFCVRCKRVMNHNIVSVVDGAPAKVRSVRPVPRLMHMSS